MGGYNIIIMYGLLLYGGLHMEISNYNFPL